MRLLFVFELFMMFTAVAGECHCYNASSCTTSPATTSHQNGGCIKGWLGPTCQKQNVALKRPAIQTSVFYEWFQTTRPLNLTADYAVDGLVSTHLRDSPCAHTDGGDTTPSWTVFLNTSCHDKIHNMKLYLRTTWPNRNDGMVILVDDQICYDWSSNERPDNVTDVTCRRPLSGTSVTIRTPQELLTLCEVQIFVCSDGWFGVDCDKQCHCLNKKDMCDKITGYCSSGCISGFTGTNCQTLCSDGWFGDNCDKQCHCLDNTDVCNKMTGHCPSGCTLGFSGANCQTRNVALKRPATQTSVYNEDPETSQPLNLTADYAVDGLISDQFSDSPCARTGDGDMTPSWTVVLNASSHEKIHRMKLYLRKTSPSRNDGMVILVDGQICYSWSSTEPPDNVMEVTCRQPLSGNTVTIRKPQEFLTLCEVQIFVCSDGWFGDKCDKQCHCLDNKELCDKVTGHCSSGCTPGFSGANCQSVCSDGWFSDNCDKQCHCLDNKEVCDKITGHCTSGCIPGFSGANCQTLCIDSWFGDKCDKKCHCLDNKEVCDKVTGHCSSGCTPGFSGANCQSVCSDGWFGDNCDKQCRCLDTKEVCDKINGHCSSGCTPAFSGANCQTPRSLNTDQRASSPMTLAVGISCGVILIIVLVASLWIRRLQMKIKALETTRDEPYASLDQTTMEQISETCYTEMAEDRYDARYINSPVR